jgi:hypothetical protein
MPKYAVLLYRNEADQPAQNSPEQYALYQAWGTFRDEISKTNVMTGSSGLQPTSTATTVRVRAGKTLTTDGPFAETKEQLGGVFVFECQDLDEAIQWAARIPDAAYGSVELRPIWGEG